MLHRHGLWTNPASLVARRDDAHTDDLDWLAAVVDHTHHIGITLDDIQSLLVNRHGLAAYCPVCRRWADLNLGNLAMQGHGRRRLRGFKPRYRTCGGPGQVNVRPPLPSWAGLAQRAEFSAPA